MNNTTTEEAEELNYWIRACQEAQADMRSRYRNVIYGREVVACYEDLAAVIREGLAA